MLRSTLRERHWSIVGVPSVGRLEAGHIAGLKGWSNTIAGDESRFSMKVG